MARLLGVDVHARYQKGLQASKLPHVDFVITKCTGGNGFVIDGWETMLAGAELTGVYHYAREKGYQGTAKAEAEHFISEARKAPSDSMLVLDWEESSNTNLGDTDWVLEWCQIVEKALGRKPVIYTGNNVLLSYPQWWDWSNKYKYYLWYARYPYTKAVGWVDWDFPTVPNWPDEYVAIWQYSSAGGIDGWAGALDLNIFYGDKTKWKTVVGSTTVTEDSPKGNTVGKSDINWAKSMVGKYQYQGMCEKFVRTCFGFGAKYGTATAAYQASAKAGAIHKDYNPPAGVPVFWGLTYEPAGHVALSIGGGKAISTSNERGKPPIAIIDIASYTKTAIGGTTYRGWAEVYHGVRVYNGSSTANTSTTSGTGGYAGYVIDGSFGSTTIKALQTYMTKKGTYDCVVDGSFGVESVKALQRLLKLHGIYNDRVVDGDFSFHTIRGLQQFLQKQGYYLGGVVDGKFGTLTVKELQRFLQKN